MDSPHMSDEAARDIAVTGAKQFAFAFVGVLMIVFLFWAKLPIAFGFDPNEEKCLPDLHLTLMVFGQPQAVHDGELVFWKPKPGSALAYVKQEVVMKVVAGIPGDHLQVAGDRILINGRLVTTGLALAGLYHRAPADLQRDEIIPRGKLFVVGLHPHSDDSRYWGYLDQSALGGHAWKLL
jgi:conjugal transfer pilin signal peptidase TrbI